MKKEEKSVEVNCSLPKYSKPSFLFKITFDAKKTRMLLPIAYILEIVPLNLKVQFPFEFHELTNDTVFAL